MRIYVSGIGGVAMGPIAMIARDMGYEVVGSDAVESDLVEHMRSAGFEVYTPQDTGHIEHIHAEAPIDWFIYTAALPDDHPELKFAREQNIRCSKRDEFINELLEEYGLHMIAVAGTHGKTNTTGMMVWCLQQAGIPLSYSIGAEISFGNFGAFNPNSEYFIYEADEFDRNMLQFEPSISIVTNIDFDHPDTYESPEDYQEAFAQFIENTMVSYMYTDDAKKIDVFGDPGIHTIEKDPQEHTTNLPGVYIRQNARLVLELITHQFGFPESEVVQYINEYPGTSRRMEKLADNLYTDYAHHPDEIRSAIQQALEINPDVVVVYQPHQNIRQHTIQDEYTDVFEGAKEIYWLPTYLSREGDSKLEILHPEDLIAKLANPDIATPVELDDTLLDTIQTARQNGEMVLCLAAGNLDGWVRQHATD